MFSGQTRTREKNGVSQMCVTQCPDLYKYSVENGPLCVYIYSEKEFYLYLRLQIAPVYG